MDRFRIVKFSTLTGVILSVVLGYSIIVETTPANLTDLHVTESFKCKKLTYTNGSQGVC